jgi:hypothetical protein
LVVSARQEIVQQSQETTDESKKVTPDRYPHLPIGTQIVYPAGQTSVSGHPDPMPILLRISFRYKEIYSRLAVLS